MLTDIQTPYAPNAPAQVVKIRQMTPSELEEIPKQGWAQMRLVPLVLSFFAFGFGGLNLMISSIALVIMTLMFALVCLGMALSLIKLRAGLLDMARTGTITEVTAYPKRKARTRSWEVGPIEIAETGEIAALLSENTMATIGCIPKLKAAMILNGRQLKRAVPITISKDLDKFVQAGQTPQAPIQPAAPPVPPLPPPAQHSSHSASLPPPPPPDEKRCQSCGEPLKFIDQYKRWYCYRCKKYPDA